MRCVPTDSSFVVNVATLGEAPLRFADPMNVLPSRNPTGPVGVPVGGFTGLTVAVSVTGVPYVVEAVEVPSDVDVVPPPTVTWSGAEVLAVQRSSPTQRARKSCWPRGREVVMNVALPLEST